MELFDKIGKKASEAYKMTADKTGKMAKETKMKLKMGELKTKVNDIYEEIGKCIYENHVREDDETCKKEVNEKCAKIDEINDEIRSLEHQCLELRDMKKCPNCNAEIEKNAKFCHNCGEKQEEPKVEEEKTDLEETVEVESDVENETVDAEQVNQELETTIEVESNVSEELNITEEEVMDAGAEVGEEDIVE